MQCKWQPCGHAGHLDTCHSKCVSVREHLAGTGSFLPTHDELMSPGGSAFTFCFLDTLLILFSLGPLCPVENKRACYGHCILSLRSVQLKSRPSCSDNVLGKCIRPSKHRHGCVPTPCHPCLTSQNAVTSSSSLPSPPPRCFLPLKIIPILNLGNGCCGPGDSPTAPL